MEPWNEAYVKLFDGDKERKNSYQTPCVE